MGREREREVGKRKIKRRDGGKEEVKEEERQRIRKYVKKGKQGKREE